MNDPLNDPSVVEAMRGLATALSAHTHVEEMTFHYTSQPRANPDHRASMLTGSYNRRLTARG